MDRVERSVAIVATVLVLLAACSSSSSTSTSTSSATPSSSAGGQATAAYVAGFCKAFSDYMNQGQMPSSMNGSDPQAMRRDMLAFFDSQISATQDLVAKITALGTPAVAGGAQVSATLIQAFTAAESKFRSLREDAAALPTGAFASPKSLNRLLKQFGEDSSGTMLAMDAFHSNPQLRAAFSTAPECAASAING